MRGHPGALEHLEQDRRHPVVDDALAEDRALFQGVEGGRVVLEVLDDPAGLVRLVDDLRLALVELLARLDGHRHVPLIA